MYAHVLPLPMRSTISAISSAENSSFPEERWNRPGPAALQIAVFCLAELGACSIAAAQSVVTLPSDESGRPLLDQFAFGGRQLRRPAVAGILFGVGEDQPEALGGAPVGDAPRANGAILAVRGKGIDPAARFLAAFAGCGALL